MDDDSLFVNYIFIIRVLHSKHTLAFFCHLTPIFLEMGRNTRRSSIFHKQTTFNIPIRSVD